MFSFQAAAEKSNGACCWRVATVSGENFPTRSSVTLYDGLTRKEVSDAKHFRETAEAVATLASEHDETNFARRGGQWVECDQQPLQQALVDAHQCVQVYGKNQLMLSPDRPDGASMSLLVGAMPGAGKSHFCARFAEQFRAQYGTTSRIIVVSMKNFATEEPEFRDIPHQQLAVDDSFEEKPLSVDDIRALHKKAASEGATHAPAVLAIFDDVGMLSGTKLKAVVESFTNLVNLGRSLHVTTIVTTHSLAGGSFTQRLWNSCSHCVLFPSSHREKAYAALTERLKLKEAVADFLLDQPSRWLALSMTTPQIAVTQNMAVSITALSRQLRKAK